jgi:hypothetical protein
MYILKSMCPGKIQKAKMLQDFENTGIGVWTHMGQKGIIDHDL